MLHVPYLNEWGGGGGIKNIEFFFFLIPTSLFNLVNIVPKGL